MANALPGQRVINGRNGYSALEDGITTPVVTDDDGDHERDRYVFPKKRKLTVDTYHNYSTYITQHKACTIKVMPLSKPKVITNYTLSS